MQRKIAFEEHFFLPGFEHLALNMQRSGAKSTAAAAVPQNLVDTSAKRLELMDQAGIDLAILSFTSPGVQGEKTPQKAVEAATRINDDLAMIVAKHPKRYAGFAALPLQDPDAAIAELTRCVRALHFKGAMVNGYSNLGDADTGVYLDDRRYDGFWSCVEQLNVPIYLHPRDALPSQQRIFQGYDELLRAAWGWGFETGTHALRLMLSGLFDRHPRLRLILGHMGETLPFAIHRADSRIAFAGSERALKKTLAEYFAGNFYITTSGNCRTQALLNTMLEVGADRICFSTDYPYEDMVAAARWLDDCPISSGDRAKIARENAVHLFNLA